MVGTGTHHYVGTRQRSRTQKNTRLTNGNVNERNAVATNLNRSRLTNERLNHLKKSETRLAREEGAHRVGLTYAVQVAYAHYQIHLKIGA